MLIAIRVLTLRRARGNAEVPVRMFAPEEADGQWQCRFEIGWPDQPYAAAVAGTDAVQALERVMKMIGALIYTSEHHARGTLMWGAPGNGYGFPVPSGLRDLLIGDDRNSM